MNRRQKYEISYYMINRNIPKHIQIKVQKELEHFQLRQKQDGQKGDYLLQQLSLDIRNQVKKEYFGKILKTYKVLTINFSEQFIECLSLKLKEVFLSPDEVVIPQNELSKTMIGVVSGELVAFEKNKNNPCEHLPIGKINNGEFSDQRGIFFEHASNYGLKSVGMSQLVQFTHDDFMDTLKSFPKELEKFYMLKDDILFQGKFTDLKCYCCGHFSHYTNLCPLVHYVADQDKIRRNWKMQCKQENRRAPHPRKTFKYPVLFYKNQTYDELTRYRLEIIQREFSFYQLIFCKDYQNDKEFYQTVPAIKYEDGVMKIQLDEQQYENFENQDDLLSQLSDNQLVKKEVSCEISNNCNQPLVMKENEENMIHLKQKTLCSERTSSQNSIEQDNENIFNRKMASKQISNIEIKTSPKAIQHSPKSFSNKTQTIQTIHMNSNTLPQFIQAKGVSQYLSDETSSIKKYRPSHFQVSHDNISISEGSQYTNPQNEQLSQISLSKIAKYNYTIKHSSVPVQNPSQTQSPGQAYTQSTPNNYVVSQGITFSSNKINNQTSALGHATINPISGNGSELMYQNSKQLGQIGSYQSVNSMKDLTKLKSQLDRNKLFSHNGLRSRTKSTVGDQVGSRHAGSYPIINNEKGITSIDKYQTNEGTHLQRGQTINQQYLEQGQSLEKSFQTQGKAIPNQKVENIWFFLDQQFDVGNQFVSYFTKGNSDTVLKDFGKYQIALVKNKLDLKNPSQLRMFKQLQQTYSEVANPLNPKSARPSSYRYSVLNISPNHQKKKQNEQRKYSCIIQNSEQRS